MKKKIRTGSYESVANRIKTGKVKSFKLYKGNKYIKSFKLVGSDLHNKQRLSDHMKGWVGEVNANTTHDTGTEALGVAVLPPIKKIGGKIVDKTVDTITNKAVDVISNPKPKKYTIKGNLRTFKKNNYSSIKNTVKKTNIKLVNYKFTNRLNKSFNYFNNRRNTRSSNAQIDKSKITDSGIEAIQDLRNKKDKIHRINHGIRTAKNTTRAIRTIATGRYKQGVLTSKSFQGNKSYSSFYSTNAEINKDDVNNSGVEAVKGIRVGIKTSKNIVVGTKNSIKGIKKASVGTYKTGKRIYTGVKTTVRNTKNTVKAIKNAKSTVDKARIVGKTTVKVLKTVVSALKTLLNPIVLKLAAVVGTAFLFILVMSSVLLILTNAIETSFGWLDDDSKTASEKLYFYKTTINKKIDEINKEYNEVKKNKKYEYGFDDKGSELRVKKNIYRDVMSILVVREQKNYKKTLKKMEFKEKDVLNMLENFYTFTKREDTYYCNGCYCSGHKGEHNDDCPKDCTDEHIYYHEDPCYCPGHLPPRIVHNKNCSENCKDPHLMYCMEPCAECPGHKGEHNDDCPKACEDPHIGYCEGCKCKGHEAVYVKIVNHSMDDVMSKLNFTKEEKDRAKEISKYLIEIENEN